MTPERQQYLIKTFPKIYTDSGENTPFNLFHFECDDGWFLILVRLSRYIQKYIDQNNEWAVKYPDQYLPVKQIKVLQVKEKFATLRFYVAGGNERTEAIISFAEYMSGFICESTGKTNNVAVNKKGWYKTQHIDNTKNPNNYNFVDDEELRKLLWEIKEENSNQTYFDI